MAKHLLQLMTLGRLHLSRKAAAFKLVARTLRVRCSAQRDNNHMCTRSRLLVNSMFIINAEDKHDVLEGVKKLQEMNSDEATKLPRRSREITSIVQRRKYSSGDSGISTALVCSWCSN